MKSGLSQHSTFQSITYALMADALINHQDARDYWQSKDADVNGMLVGYPHVSKVDLQGSKNFLAKLGIGGQRGIRRKKVERAVDCGAGLVIPIHIKGDLTSRGYT